eukprot:TRINITY_DN4103_c0_g1_i2.p1 TRINITY_DN4103_c0_g1~~TRINITY_DN4103_c0_g1_i2.p1  ORF type:complete len:236 (-),score=36.97 TRINITY_DN4103_c0_g1_i2:93-800(-)
MIKVQRIILIITVSFRYLSQNAFVIAMMDTHQGKKVDKDLLSLHPNFDGKEITAKELYETTLNINVATSVVSSILLQILVRKSIYETEKFLNENKVDEVFKIKMDDILESLYEIYQCETNEAKIHLKRATIKHINYLEEIIKSKEENAITQKNYDYLLFGLTTVTTFFSGYTTIANFSALGKYRKFWNGIGLIASAKTLYDSTHSILKLNIFLKETQKFHRFQQIERKDSQRRRL